MIDKNIRAAFETVSNGISRRGFLEKSLKGTFATLAAVAASSIAIKPVLALGCCAGTAVGCADCSTGQPPGYSACTSSSGCSYCYWGSGCWICSIGVNEYTCCDYWDGSNCGTACTCWEVAHCCAPTDKRTGSSVPAPVKATPAAAHR